jgi:hypothetical protein
MLRLGVWSAERAAAKAGVYNHVRAVVLISARSIRPAGPGLI